MTPREPFFDPIPEPSDEPEAAHVHTNFPWMPPINVVPAIVPVEVDLVADTGVVLQLRDVLAYDRGMLLRLEGWLHPTSADRVDSERGMLDEPRVGLLLGDGTKLGAGEEGHSPDVEPSALGDDDAGVSMTLHGGGSGELQLSQSWWVHPIPDGTAELVVAWPGMDVPETFVPLDLDAVRDAARRARELWHLPDAPGGEFGWFAHAPMGGSVYRRGTGLDPEDVD